VRTRTNPSPASQSVSLESRRVTHLPYRRHSTPNRVHWSHTPTGTLALGCWHRTRDTHAIAQTDQTDRRVFNTQLLDWECMLHARSWPLSGLVACSTLNWCGVVRYSRSKGEPAHERAWLVSPGNCISPLSPCPSLSLLSLPLIKLLSSPPLDCARHLSRLPQRARQHTIRS
jgi:hypothetical protein